MISIDCLNHHQPKNELNNISLKSFKENLSLLFKLDSLI